ncbi:MAG: endolytic transglycosylase MltG [Actinomycetota bacterium]
MKTQTTETPEATKGRLRKIGLVVGVALVAILAIVFLARGVASLVGGGEAWDVEPGLPVEVTIEAGSSATSIYNTLHDAGVVRSSELQAAARAAGVEDSLQAGIYQLSTDMDAQDVVRELASGSSIAVSSTFTVIEGWTVDRIISELAEDTDYSQAEFQKALRDGAVTSPLLPEPTVTDDPIAAWEGLLYPAKYPLIEGWSPSQILQRMADEMVVRLEKVDWTRLEELGISRHEALVLASLIEWESGTDTDRPIISSVIHNRLTQGMRLQIDATVIYALGHNPGRVLAEHLKVESPYNTYLIDGLPPTPIGTASQASLEAAVNPVDSAYLFYVLGNEDGSHVFAETYQQHQANVTAAKAAGILP